MKRLGLLRHAKSSWDQPDVDDFNRPLNDRGRKAARSMGRELTRRNVRFDLVLTSMAARVRETIDGVQEKYDFDAAIHFDPRLYLADVDTLLDLVRGLPEDAGVALIVGHNPGLQQLVLDLTGKGDARRLRIEDKYPTGALAIIELPVSAWQDVEPGYGKIAELILPKDLD